MDLNKLLNVIIAEAEAALKKANSQQHLFNIIFAAGIIQERIIQHKIKFDAEAVKI